MVIRLRLPGDDLVAPCRLLGITTATDGNVVGARIQIAAQLEFGTLGYPFRSSAEHFVVGVGQCPEVGDAGRGDNHGGWPIQLKAEIVHIVVRVDFARRGVAEHDRRRPGFGVAVIVRRRFANRNRVISD